MDAVSSVARANTIHPVRDFLKSLEWDGVERLDTLLVDYLGAEDCPYTRAVTRKAFTAAVARIMRPGCKFDYVLTLAGPQGRGKSTLINKMSCGWYTDSLAGIGTKEAYEGIQGFWLVELGELAAMKKTEIEVTKNFISKQVDSYRAPMGAEWKITSGNASFLALPTPRLSSGTIPETAVSGLSAWVRSPRSSRSGMTSPRSWCASFGRRPSSAVRRASR